MDIKELLSRNYAATCKRGKITYETTKDEFLNKMIMEVSELAI